MDIEGAEKELFSRDPHRWLDRTTHLVIELHDHECTDVFEQVMKDYEFERLHSGDLTLCMNIRRH